MHHIEIILKYIITVNFLASPIFFANIATCQEVEPLDNVEGLVESSTSSTFIEVPPLGEDETLEALAANTDILTDDPLGPVGPLDDSSVSGAAFNAGPGSFNGVVRPVQRNRNIQQSDTIVPAQGAQVAQGPPSPPLLTAEGDPAPFRDGAASVQTRQPFPAWLRAITGVNQWPAEDPPYIPMMGVDLSIVPTDIPQRELGDCRGVERHHCSFDCYRCSAIDDVSSCPVMSQTFDDGPSPSTPKLLQQLPSKTTFFTQGINVVRFPETFRQQYADGHLLASHTWSHANLPGLTNEEIVAQIQWSIWAMNATAGVVPKYFRPPYGAIDDRVRAITRQFGLVAVFWDRDTFDWRVNDNSKTETEVYQDVRQWQTESNNALILEHDSTIKTVNVGIEIAKILGTKQMTVADCVNGRWYQNQ